MGQASGAQSCFRELFDCEIPSCSVADFTATTGIAGTRLDRRGPDPDADITDGLIFGNVDACQLSHEATDNVPKFRYDSSRTSYD